jgi:hypothetical protein
MIEIKLTLADVRKLERGEAVLTTVRAGVGAMLDINVTCELPKQTATGAEIKEFWENGWPEGYYHEGEDAEVKVQNEDGVWIIRDERNYDLTQLGHVLSDGSGGSVRPDMTFAEAFAQWKAGQSK